MRAHAWALAVLVACGGGGGGATPDAAHASDAAHPDAPHAPDAAPDAFVCLPPGSAAPFVRDPDNPVLRAGTHTYTDGDRDMNISDPSLSYDAAAHRFDLYYMGGHAAQFSPTTPPPQQIHHATSPDGSAWTIDDAPALAISPGSAAWDHTNTETPSVVENPDAPADHRYLLVYSGANGAFPGQTFAGYQIGAAFSADGKTFTRVSAADSPHGQAGLVLTGSDVYPTATGSLVADPEVAYVAGTYHLWFSSFACGSACPTATDFGVGHATSPDGVHWTVGEAPIASLLRTAGAPTTGGQQPSVVYDAVHCQWEMWLRSDLGGETDAQKANFNNMAGVYRATSTDAVTWHADFTGARDLTWDGSAAGEALGIQTGADVTIVGGGRVMAYVGFDDQDVPSGFALPENGSPGFGSGVMVLELATRAAQP